MIEQDDIEVGDRRYAVKGEPDWCPICHYSCQPKALDRHLCETSSNRPDLEVVYKCPRAACGRLFIARYVHRSAFPSGYGKDSYQFRGVVPRTPQPAPIPDDVAEISSDFATIYAEARAAEAYGLGQVAGAGYRKALEFLIKDYCVAQDPDETEAIRSLFLGRCITEHVTDERVKECARRAAWLGNDEVHYTRKWEDKDLDDLKILIELTVGWIHSDVLTKKYLEDMP